MSRGESANDLVQRWEAGNGTAAEELYHRYAQRLCALAEREIGRRLGPLAGAEEIVQSVFRTFFRRAAEGEIQIDHSGALWKLLVTIALNKIRQKAGRPREVPIDAEKLLVEVVAREPTPEEAAALTDEIEAVLKGLQPRSAEVFQLRLQGHSTSEIADRMCWSRWTIRRDLGRSDNRLRKRLGEDLKH